MLFCFGTVCWGGYLERYIDFFVENYITIYRKLISLGINYDAIADPKVVYNNDTPGPIAEKAIKTIKSTTGKTLQLIFDKHKYTANTIMYSTRNRLRNEFKKSYPLSDQIYFYFPIDDKIRPDIVHELLKLSRMNKPAACMFKFFVKETTKSYSAGTRPITSWKDIHPSDWGGYCAYTIFHDIPCPLYPAMPIPNIAFYVELYKAGYKEYASQKVCIDHLRHSDSHHFKFKDTKMSKKVEKFLINQRKELIEGGYK